MTNTEEWYGSATGQKVHCATRTKWDGHDPVALCNQNIELFKTINPKSGVHCKTCERMLILGYKP